MALISSLLKVHPLKIIHKDMCFLHISQCYERQYSYTPSNEDQDTGMPGGYALTCLSGRETVFIFLLQENWQAFYALEFCKPFFFFFPTTFHHWYNQNLSYLNFDVMIGGAYT